MRLPSSHSATMTYRLFHRIAVTLLLIAASIVGTSTSAQFATKSGAAATSSVVTTPYVRAELLAHAPQGVAPG